MAEAFGIAAGVVGVAGFTIQLIESAIKLRELYNKVKNAPESLERIVFDIETTSLILREIGKERALHPHVDFEIVERCVAKCQGELNRICSTIAKLQRVLHDVHATTKLSAKLRTAFKDSEIKQLSSDVRNAQDSLQLALVLYQGSVTFGTRA